MAPSIASPFLRAWHRQLRATWASTPRPVDPPQAHSPGPAPARVLIIGSGPATGWGVLTHDLALPGQLARVLTERTGNGAEVDLIGTPFLTIREAEGELRDLRLWRYDVVVVVLGIPDVVSFTSPGEWAERMAALLRMLRRSGEADTQIVVAGVQPMRSVRDFDGPLGSLLDRRATQFNRRTESICHDRPRVGYVRLSGERADTRGGESGVHRRWAEQIAATIPSTPVADAARPARRLRHGADDEQERQSALRSMGILDAAGPPALDRIVRLAREAYGTRCAAVTLIDGDRQTVTSGVGFDTADVPRAVSFCTHTIRRSEAMVVADSWEDTRFADNPLVLAGPGIRFYAGYPVESPAGYRIGALCVFDPVPHQTDQLDLSLLQSLAKLAQRELALGEHRAARATGDDPFAAVHPGEAWSVSGRPRAVPAR